MTFLISYSPDLKSLIFFLLSKGSGYMLTVEDVISRISMRISMQLDSVFSYVDVIIFSFLFIVIFILFIRSLIATLLFSFSLIAILFISFSLSVGA
jgi:hypothetical protein